MIKNKKNKKKMSSPTTNNNRENLRLSFSEQNPPVQTRTMPSGTTCSDSEEDTEKISKSVFLEFDTWNLSSYESVSLFIYFFYRQNIIIHKLHVIAYKLLYGNKKNWKSIFG